IHDSYPRSSALIGGSWFLLIVLSPVRAPRRVRTTTPKRPTPPPPRLETTRWLRRCPTPSWPGPPTESPRCRARRRSRTASVFAAADRSEEHTSELQSLRHL